ncbi:UDP-glucose 4-epimerase GalE [Catenulispora sp. NF23]|uniref:UDP-glucose 4-epimerase n=1 Tax=Catenulispora pinistramenti TaxID=2705254 RepID=A0ABS5KQE2_9ACTN|nr:UDP-glucose 4-epimerase GalE [Catenulispora pinistramenti]MBS2533669.1 UDP-glucose 4-epimerase GalE [Catenulispora pinistramenti]MBS2548266.1 UDP-glucose 4-epimerase GalE [Catenulispora pinistramenti]
MSWLVTGGAGYIGAHVVRALLADGHDVVVLDDLSTGFKERVPDGVPIVLGTVLDRAALDRALLDHGVTGVVHLAGKKQVGESVAKPLHYFHENVEGLRILLAAMGEHGVRSLVFSSSASAYGMPDVEFVTEDTPCEPVSPYGLTKLVGEQLIAAAAVAQPLAYVNIRYFNVAGTASPELADRGAANLIPLIFERIDAGLPPRIFGDDYPTPDGTGVRDYIHVADLAEAHSAAVRRLTADPRTALTVNAGRGVGVSVREIIQMVGDVVGRPDLTGAVEARRPGDVARSVAAADRIRTELGWTAHLGVREMVESAWAGWRR